MQCYMMYRLRFAGLFILWILINYAASQDYDDNATVYDEDLSDYDAIEFDRPFFNKPLFSNQKEVDGRTVVEGDILLPEGIGVIDWISDLRSREEVTPNLWKDGVIYYTFDESISEETQKLVYAAIKEWESQSCLKFKKCVDTVTCVTITALGTSGCSSSIGCVVGGQKLYLAKSCDELSIIMHEFGHAIGFYHEQSRMDRDEYISFIEKNVDPEKKFNFVKAMKDWGTEYDYSSIMHYSGKIFSIDPVMQNTMVTYNPHYQHLMGKSKRLTFRDIHKVNLMYGCNDACPNKEVECQNGGYLTLYKYKDENCYCDCPPRITGTYCENMPENYEYYEIPACSKNVTEPSVIETPGYPERSFPAEKCSYWIQAPEGKRIAVEFEDFSFQPRTASAKGEQECYYERVEIRYEDTDDGEVYCAEELMNQTLTSTWNHFKIVMGGVDEANGKRGLKAHVNFV